MKRDTQRKKVYQAEGAAFAKDSEANVELSTVADIEKFVNHVFSMKRVQKAFPRAFGNWDTPSVGDGRARRRAGGNVYGIHMPKWSRCKWIVLHELAHTISLRVDSRIAFHGWEYCETYLLLVRYVLGLESYNRLKDSFKSHRIKFRAPRKRREITTEQRVALIERMAIARAAKVAREVSL